MSIQQELADALAKDALDAEEKTGDPKIVDRISSVLGDTSTTTQEAYLTSIRVRRAERRARLALQEMLEKSGKA